MAKAKTGAKKAKPAAKKTSNKLGLLKTASKKVAKATAKLVKAASKMAPSLTAAKAKAEKSAKTVTAKVATRAKAAAAPTKAAAASAPAKVGAKAAVTPAKGAPAPVKEAASSRAVPQPPPVKGAKGAEKPTGKAGRAPAPPVERVRPRATKLPPQQEALTKREMEQILTIGQGRGVGGEGSVKGRLVVKDELPHLMVIGRDKRELEFLLQGPDQEVLPAYVDHKVSVSGLIRKLSNNGGIIDVRKYSAKKPEVEAVVPEVIEEKLKYLSPGELEQMANPGMGAGMKGFGALRGTLEMSGDDFFLVVSNGGTRQQVSFLLEGKGGKGLRKNVGQTVLVTGVLEKTSGWGGTVQTETVEPKPSEHRSMSRDNIEIVHVEGGGEPVSLDVRLNQGLTVRLPEKAGFTWAVEPTTAKRVSLREANFEPSGSGAGTREFFFTPRNPGLVDVDFFLARVLVPSQVTQTFKMVVNVKP
ncbi:MAG: protease inhibitor I42 family protein [Myxococcaceae bacterium]